LRMSSAAMDFHKPSRSDHEWLLCPLKASLFQLYI
jgi:hypothetical protein